MRKDPVISVTHLIKDGMRLYFTTKYFEVQIWVTYCTQWSKHSYRIGQSDLLCDIPQRNRIVGENTWGYNWSMFSKQYGLKTKGAKGSPCYVQVTIWLKKPTPSTGTHLRYSSAPNRIELVKLLVYPRLSVCTLSQLVCVSCCSWDHLKAHLGFYAECSAFIILLLLFGFLSLILHHKSKTINFDQICCNS